MQMTANYYRKAVSRLSIFVLGIFTLLCFFSCGSSPQATSTARGKTPTVQSPQNNVDIFFVDTVTYSFKEGKVNAYRSPEDDTYIVELPLDRDLTYLQKWDNEARDLLGTAISRFSADEKGGKLGTRDTRSFAAYGTAQGLTEWVNTANKATLSAEPRIDLGYLVKDGQGYFLITQRDTPITGDTAGRKSLRVTYCMTDEQVREMAGFIGIKIYDRPLILFFGDNVTSGSNATIQDADDPASAYPAVLQERLRISVVNSGNSWDTTKTALERIDDDILKYEPDIVVINLGLADFFEKIPPSETGKNLQTLITAIKNEERKIFLTRFYDEPILGNTMSYWEMSEKDQNNLLTEYNTMFSNLSKANDAELITDIWDGLQYDDTIGEDYINPTAEGHRIMAGNFLKFLRPYLEANGFLK